VSSYILELGGYLVERVAEAWPFVLKRTLWQERAAGDYIVEHARKQLDELRALLNHFREENAGLKSEIEANSIANWRKATAEILQLRADLKSAADTILRLQRGLTFYREAS
jgi:hypothetical protein